MLETSEKAKMNFKEHSQSSKKEKRLKNNYNFGVVKLHLKFNQRTKSTPHKFQTRFPSQNLILFQPDLSLSQTKR